MVSHEFLSFPDRAQARWVIESLAGVDVHVVLAVRDAARALPAQWQTLTRNRGDVSWPHFVRSLQRGDAAGHRGRGFRTFSRTQGIPRIVDAWAATLPPDRLHVVTVPSSRSDPMLLWRRFAAAVRLDPDLITSTPEHLNPSLGHASAELMRLVNRAVGPLPKQQYTPTLKAVLATSILTGRAGLEAPAQLNARTLSFTARWNGDARRAIATSRAEVIGSWADLPVHPVHDVGAAPLTNPAAHDVIAAACTARDGLVDLIASRSRLLGKPVDPEALGTPTTPTRWAAAEEGGQAGAVAEVASLARTAIGLYDELRAGDVSAAATQAARSGAAG